MDAVSPAARMPPERNGRVPASSEVAADDFLAPIIAGAFARGVAETFALLEMPAFLLDRDGHVLFATEATRAHAGGLMVQAGHLLSGTRADNRTLSGFVERTLRDPPSHPVAKLKAAGLTLQALPVPGGGSDASQLLHAIVLVTAGPTTAVATP